jgi:hypothetical protein
MKNRDLKDLLEALKASGTIHTVSEMPPGGGTISEIVVLATDLD